MTTTRDYERKADLIYITTVNTEDAAIRYLIDSEKIMDVVTDSEFIIQNNESNKEKDYYKNISHEYKQFFRNDIHKSVPMYMFNAYNFKEVNYKNKRYAIQNGDGFCSFFLLSYGLTSNNYIRWSNMYPATNQKAVITLNMFEFHCEYNINTDDVTVNVKYSKRENYHKNRVTIACFKVLEPTNTSILEAIETWKNEFLNEISSVSTKEMSNSVTEYYNEKINIHKGVAGMITNDFRTED